MKDLYQILGVSRQATQDEIKRAYRRLASQNHPDKGGDTALFQEIQHAYDILGNPEQRADYDRPKFQGPQFQWQQGPQDLRDIFNMFGHGFAEQFARSQRRGHIRINLNINLLDAARGGKKTVTIGTQDGVTGVEIDIPPAVNHGDHVQYPGLAPGGIDLVVTYLVAPDPAWHRENLDLICRKSVVVWDLILGAELRLQDIFGNDIMTRIPPHSQPGTRLRLKQKGLRDRHGQTGDAYVILDTYLPENIPESILTAIQTHHK